MDAPSWREHEPPDEWASQPLSGRLLGAVLSGAITLTLIAVWIAMVWPR